MKIRYAAAMASVAVAALAAAAGMGPSAKASPTAAGATGGAVPITAGGRAHMFPRPQVLADVHNGDSRGGSPPLQYHSGPIMKTAVNYIVLWNPGHLQNGTATGYSSKYTSLLSRWFKDVGGGGLYANNTQYSQGGGVFIQNSAKFGGVFTDTTPFPTGQCSNPDTGTNCITDANLAAEAAAVAKAHSISAGLTKDFFVFTPAGEGSCFDTGCSYPSYTYYCAYHSYTNATFGNSPYLLYANMPYPTDPVGNNCYASYLGQTFPNGDVNADAAINVTSHEQMETVTDPLLSAWYDAAGYEIGDECAWNFGSNNWPSGGNQERNGHPYDLQLEASNHSADCVTSGP